MIKNWRRRQTRGLSFFALALSFIPSVAAASGWIEAVKSENGSIHFVDIDSLEQKDGIYTFWTKHEFPKESHKEFKEDRVQRKIDCKNRTAMLIYGVVYLKNGETWSGELSKTWFPIVPDTILDGMREFVCPESE